MVAGALRSHDPRQGIEEGGAESVQGPEDVEIPEEFQERPYVLLRQPCHAPAPSGRINTPKDVSTMD
jgi:hypothetical protein